MAYVFTPPTVEEGPAGGAPPFGYYRLARGITVLKQGDSFVEVRWPTEDELTAADAYWRGGYQHELTTAERDDLVAGGYGDFITEA